MTPLLQTLYYSPWRFLVFLLEKRGTPYQNTGILHPAFRHLLPQEEQDNLQPLRRALRRENPTLFRPGAASYTFQPVPGDFLWRYDVARRFLQEVHQL